MPNDQTTDDYANRVDYLRQVANEIDDSAARAPCSEAEIIRQAADEIERLRSVLQYIAAMGGSDAHTVHAMRRAAEGALK